MKKTLLLGTPYLSLVFWPFVQVYERDQACLKPLRPRDLSGGKRECRSKNLVQKYRKPPPQRLHFEATQQATGNRYLLVGGHPQ
jgi:hypothetical protein